MKLHIKRNELMGYATNLAVGCLAIMGVGVAAVTSRDDAVKKPFNDACEDYAVQNPQTVMDKGVPGPDNNHYRFKLEGNPDHLCVVPSDILIPVLGPNPEPGS